MGIVRFKNDHVAAIQDYGDLQWGNILITRIYCVEDHGKLTAKGDIGFFIGYSESGRGFKIYIKRTKKVTETVNVNFDELLSMAFEQRNALQTAPPTPLSAAPLPQNLNTPSASTTVEHQSHTPINSSTDHTNIASTS
ncbi:hypothetical protein Tco_0276407 [Tanacetum coccineum]